MTDKIAASVWLQAIPVVCLPQGRGFSACAFAFKDSGVSMLEFGQYSSADAALHRIEEIDEFIKDWEALCGVQRDVTDVCEQFAKGDSLPITWKRLSRAQCRALEIGNLELVEQSDREFRPDLDEDEKRLRYNVPGGIRPMIRDQVGRMENVALTLLAQQYGHEFSREDAMQMAAQWEPRAIPNWTVEIAPVEGDHGEALGYAVFALLYSVDETSVKVWDLISPLDEVNARMFATAKRLSLVSALRVPFHPLHRDGLEAYVTSWYDKSHVLVDPFALAGSDLTLFLNWGVAQRRPSFDSDGTSRMVDGFAVPYASEDEAEKMRRNIGCVDMPG